MPQHRYSVTIRLSIFQLDIQQIVYQRLIHIEIMDDISIDDLKDKAVIVAKKQIENHLQPSGQSFNSLKKSAWQYHIRGGAIRSYSIIDQNRIDIYYLELQLLEREI